MRRFNVDLDIGKVVAAPGTTSLLESIEEKRSPNAAYEVVFLRGVTPQELSVGATGRMEIKVTGKYDANALTGAESWIKTGTGANTVYTFTVDLMNDLLDALLGVEAPKAISAVNTSTETLSTATAHGLTAGNIVQFQNEDTLIAPLLPIQDYYVIAGGLTATDFRVSLTAGGTAVNLTSAGTGTTYVARVDDDEETTTLMMAIQWTADGRTNETQDIDFVLHNDIVRDTDFTTPPTPADVVLNVQAGREAIVTGTDTGSIEFDTPFAADANVAVIVTVIVPDGGDTIWGTVKRESVSETGFEYQLSGPVVADGYQLSYMAVAI